VNVLDILETGLLRHGVQRTKAALGDRSAYIGMSDIAKAADCLRAAVANKISAYTETSLEKQLRLHRGHWFESGIMEAFTAAGQSFLYQLAVSTVHNGVTIKGHLDFVFIGPAGQVRVVELKSCERLPETAYASYEMQLFGQLGLLESLWNTPSFALHEGEAPMNFPALVKRECNVALPKQPAICGHILCVSMSDAEVFGPYEPNALLFAAALGLAEQVWSAAHGTRNGVTTLNDLPVANGFNPLCDWCSWNDDCPRFTGIQTPELEDDLQEIRRLKTEKEALEARIQAMDKQLRMTCKGAGGTQDWLTAETLRIRLVTCEGKRMFDRERLQNELEKRLDADTVIDIMESACRDGKPYDRLMFGAINKKENRHGLQV
jgi:hypothetical protein